jgi:hypothetical protein
VRRGREGERETNHQSSFRTELVGFEIKSEDTRFGDEGFVPGQALEHVLCCLPPAFAMRNLAKGGEGVGEGRGRGRRGM